MISRANRYRLVGSVLAFVASTVLGSFAAKAGSASIAPGNVPLYFEANHGQSGSAADFLAQGTRSQFLISPDTAEILLFKPAALRSFEARAVQMEFVGASPQAQIYGAAELPGQINYFIGNDSSKWETGVPTFAKVRVAGIYPGVGLVYYGDQRQLEYDLMVAPGADPGSIAVHFAGVDRMSINPAGDLVLNIGDAEIYQPRPVIYQMVDGKRVDINGGYRMLDANTAAFAPGDYDRSRLLVIDPILSYSTYFGGTGSQGASSVAVDTNGFVYVAGETTSSQLATAGAFQTSYAGGTGNGDAFISKYSFNGTNLTLVYCTYLGGSQDDLASSIAVDNGGHVFVTGYTDSTNFPTMNAIQPHLLGRGYLDRQNGQTYYSGNAFVTELDPTGSHLVYSTYLGGSGGLGSAGVPAGVDEGTGIKVDSADNAYIVGYTSSTNFPVMNPLVVTNSGTNMVFNYLAGIYNVFVSEIGAGGSPLKYSTYLGGSNIDAGYGIAIDGSGAIYVAGYTDSTNFPVTTNAVQSILDGTTNVPLYYYDAFATKLIPGATNLSLAYSTFLGGTNDDWGFAIAVDGSGDAYVTGGTASPNFTNTVTYIAGLTNLLTNNVNAAILVTNVFLTEINPQGTGIVHSAVFGGTTTDIGYGVALDPMGNIYVCGASSSPTNFPAFNNLGSLAATNAGQFDAFVTAFSTNFTGVIYSALIGGVANDEAYGIAVDPASDTYIVGQTFSVNFPTNHAIDSTLSGTSDAFLTKIVPDTTPPLLSISVQNGQGQVSWNSGLPYEPELVHLFDLQSDTNLLSTNWVVIPGSPILSNDEYSVVFYPTNGMGFFRLEPVNP
jgi:Beta-propeller repeat